MTPQSSATGEEITDGAGVDDHAVSFEVDPEGSIIQDGVVVGRTNNPSECQRRFGQRRSTP